MSNARQDLRDAITEALEEDFPRAGQSYRGSVAERILADPRVLPLSLGMGGRNEHGEEYPQGDGGLTAHGCRSDHAHVLAILELVAALRAAQPGEPTDFERRSMVQWLEHRAIIEDRRGGNEMTGDVLRDAARMIRAPVSHGSERRIEGWAYSSRLDGRHPLFSESDRSSAMCKWEPATLLIHDAPPPASDSDPGTLKPAAGMELRPTDGPNPGTPPASEAGE